VGFLHYLFGNIQDREIDRNLEAANPALHEQVVGQEKVSVFGKYMPLDQAKIQALPETDKTKIANVTKIAKQDALFTVAIFPTIMLICYLILIMYFRAKGGYEAVSLEEQKE
jgi:hypothetical protein